MLSAKKTPLRFLPLAVPLLLGAPSSLPLLAQAGDGEPKPAAKTPPPLVLEAVEIEPSQPGADTLCRLRVKLKNDGNRKASVFGFEVRINGQELPVYRNHLFMQAVDPETLGELHLFNFWTTETSRPFPKDGKLTVEVSLKEARWVEVKMEEGVEVWTPLEPVPGLPLSKSVTLQLKKPG